MGWKYRKRISVFPGFRINLSKSGLSATVGIKGFNVNVGKKGAYLNTGIPGTGIYDRTRLGNQPSNKSVPQNNDSQNLHTPIENGAVEIKSFQPELLTSEGLFGLKESIVKARETKNELKKESAEASNNFAFSEFLMIVTYLLIFGFFMKRFRENYESAKVDAEYAEQAYKNFALDIDFNLDQSLLNDYSVLNYSFEKLITSQRIWDITSSRSIDRVKKRSLGSTVLTRTPVAFSMDSLEYINTKYEALKLHNANGGDLYVYPGFIVMPSERSNDFAIVDFRDIKTEHHQQTFCETEFVPSDTKIVDRTWQYVNKNGMPDRRYNPNPQIPIVLYYEFSLMSPRGLRESFLFSNADAAESFCSALDKYQDSIIKLKWDKEKQVNE